MVAQLRGLLGLEQPRLRLLNMQHEHKAAQQDAAEGDNSAADGAGAPARNASASVRVLSALTTGLAPWEVDALLRRWGLP